MAVRISHCPLTRIDAGCFFGAIPLGAGPDQSGKQEMSEADPRRADDALVASRFDEDDHLKSAFVREVLAAVDAGDDERVRGAKNKKLPCLAVEV